MSEKWTVKGQIEADHLLPELREAFGSTNALEGVTVKLSARSKVLTGWGWWNSWGQVRTDARGAFEFTENHGGDRRQFKIEILFDDDRIRIKEGQETSIGIDSEGFPLDIEFDLTDKDWHEIHNDDDGPAPDGRQAGTINLGTVDVPRTLVRQHADIWALYQKIFDVFDDFGADWSFARKVTVKFPMGIANNASASASYSNPVNGNIYIKGDNFYSSVLIHELMHQWTFERTTGEDAMAWQLAKHATTHAGRENRTLVAFHEGFAEWCSYKVLQAVTDRKLLNFTEQFTYKLPDLPLTRDYIGDALSSSDRNLANVDFTERGWHSLFNILTVPYLDKCDFNRPMVEDAGAEEHKNVFYNIFSTDLVPAARIDLEFKDVLSVLFKNPARDVDAYLKGGDLDFFHFLARAGKLVDGVDKDTIARVKSYLDPNDQVNPADL